jgi:hypothetical protein
MTLELTAPNFETTYGAPQEQEMYVDTSEVVWAVALTPKSGVSGKQQVTLRLTQRLASGNRIPATVNPTYTTGHELSIKSPGQSVFAAAMDIAKTAPALITAFAGLITAIVGVFVFIRNRRQKT